MNLFNSDKNIELTKRQTTSQSNVNGKFTQLRLCLKQEKINNINN